MTKFSTHLCILLKYLTVVCDFVDMLWKAYWACVNPHTIMLKKLTLENWRILNFIASLQTKKLFIHAIQFYLKKKKKKKYIVDHIFDLIFNELSIKSRLFLLWC